MPQPHISRFEWRAAALFAVLIAVVTTLPYVVGTSSQTADSRFSGAVIGADDFHSYIGKMRLGARGLWDFYLFYTPEPHDAVPLVFLPYIVPGQVVGRFIQPHDPALTPALIGVFHALRIVADAVLIVVLYRFIAVYLRAPGQRMTALILAALGGGIGWLLVLFDSRLLPPDFYIPEGFSFVILLSLPHLALARAALLGGFIAVFGALETARWLPWSLLAGACWCLVGLSVPFYLAVLYCVLGVWGLALWIRARRLPLRLLMRGGLAAALTLPLFIYYAVAFASNATFAAWSAQNNLVSPSPVQYALAYSLFILLSAPALRWAWRRARTRPLYALPAAWVLIVPLLVYLPINVQRRMAEAVIVPLAVLAAHGLALILRRLPLSARPRAHALVVGVACLSSVFLLLTTTLGATSRILPTYIPTAALDAFQWLNTHAPENAVVLTSFTSGNLLPAYTELRPYVGHGPETIDVREKELISGRFFADTMTASERQALYADARIAYILYGPSEAAFATDSAQISPRWVQGLRLIYARGGYRIYAVPAPRL
jgi:hypothetical protein